MEMTRIKEHVSRMALVNNNVAITVLDSGECRHSLASWEQRAPLSLQHCKLRMAHNLLYCAGAVATSQAALICTLKTCKGRAVAFLNACAPCSHCDVSQLLFLYLPVHSIRLFVNIQPSLR